MRDEMNRIQSSRAFVRYVVVVDDDGGARALLCGSGVRVEKEHTHPSANRQPNDASPFVSRAFSRVFF
jgi:hypothetical protein